MKLPNPTSPHLGSVSYFNFITTFCCAKGIEKLLQNHGTLYFQKGYDLCLVYVLFILGG